MIKSMTGYGKGISTLANKKFIVEIKTLNSKQADINLKLPKEYMANEIEFRNKISEVLERGKIDCTLYIETNAEKQEISINKDVFRAFYNQTLWLQDEFMFDKNEHINYLLANPKISETIATEPEKEELAAIGEAFSQALQAVDDFRINEGCVLNADLVKRTGIMMHLLSDVEPLEVDRVPRIKERLLAQLRDLEYNSIDANRMEQELIYYLEKLDFTEEKVRLRKHIDYFNSTLAMQASQGKKLGFIAQEMTREINTLGSKANDAAIQQIVVLMKDELEKIKEQLSNIL